MKRLFLLLLLSQFLVSQAWPQETTVTQNTIDEKVSRKADELLAAWNTKDSPGCAVAVMKDGRTVLKRGYGMANLEHGIRITPATVFNVASMSKQFTAMSIALLAEQGKISLDDNIRKYLPEIPDYESPITIRHLIYHTSGLRDYTNLIELSDDRIENLHTDRDILEILARQKRLNFKPGTEHLYDNSGYVLLGIIVERVSGKSLARFQKEFIFSPLGMNSTRLFDDRSMVVPNRATGYFQKGDGTYGARASLWDRVGDGGMLTTVEDLGLWDQNFYQPRVGSAALISQMSVPGTLSNGENFEYAFGLEPVRYRNLPMVMHGGGIRGYRAQMYRFPDQRTTIICLCNNGAISPTKIIEQIADVYLEGNFPAKRSEAKTDAPAPAQKFVAVPEKELVRFAGLYANKANDTVRRVHFKGGKLVYSRSAASESELLPLGGGSFRMAGGTDNVEVIFDLRRAASMSVAVNGGKPVVYEMVRPALEAGELNQYTGGYYSEELETEYLVVTRDDKLVIQRRNYPEALLTPRYADVYVENEVGRIRFVRDKAGRVTGLVLNGAQVRELEFNKSVRGFRRRR